MLSRKEFFINRNVEIIRLFNKKTSNGTPAMVALEEISNECEGVSFSVVSGVIFTKNYPQAAEAWAIIHKEEENEAKEKQGNKTATMPIAGEAATA